MPLLAETDCVPVEVSENQICEHKSTDHFPLKFLGIRK